MILAEADAFRSFGLDRREGLWAVRRLPDDKPLPLFEIRAAPDQGVNYAKGVWHHFLLPLEAESDFLVIDRAGPGDNLDEIELDAEAAILVRI